MQFEGDFPVEPTVTTQASEINKRPEYIVSKMPAEERETLVLNGSAEFIPTKGDQEYLKLRVKAGNQSGGSALKSNKVSSSVIPISRESPTTKIAMKSPVSSTAGGGGGVRQQVDILFVLDTSASMRKNLINFKKKFGGFLDYFSGWDWRLAITNADNGGTGFSLSGKALKGKIMRLEKRGRILNKFYLSSNTPNYNEIFLDSISQHTHEEYEASACALPPYCQGRKEQPLKSLKLALQKNEDFFRPSADLVVVVASNSEERADNSNRVTQPKEVIRQFQNLYGTRKNFKVYGVIVPEGDKSCLSKNIYMQEGAFSEKIARLSQITGGEVFSLCDSSYQDMANSIFYGLRRT